ncbi:CLP protease regulatory subunit CLPX2 [Cucumis melo var. makuwa]|uniref:CLP protease regulatory subunit CLPX2 n=1 Tax=Cucumis melo var. makuwa TaxID=1194695 RepID=A0A5D3C9F1_CUCMM|nr:CLP protease regulatory subunit CLPX2 [Cucumis melo var. makuwa]
MTLSSLPPSFLSSLTTLWPPFSPPAFLIFLLRSKVGWVMRCSLEEEQKSILHPYIFWCLSTGLKSFHKTLERFLMKQDYSIWYRKHPQTSLQLPSESLGGSYVEKVMFNGSSVRELVKQTASSSILTSEFQSATQHWGARQNLASPVPITSPEATVILNLDYKESSVNMVGFKEPHLRRRENKNFSFERNKTKEVEETFDEERENSGHLFFTTGSLLNQIAAHLLVILFPPIL